MQNSKMKFFGFIVLIACLGKGLASLSSQEKLLQLEDELADIESYENELADTEDFEDELADVEEFDKLRGRENKVARVQMSLTKATKIVKKILKYAKYLSCIPKKNYNAKTIIKAAKCIVRKSQKKKGKKGKGKKNKKGKGKGKKGSTGEGSTTDGGTTDEGGMIIQEIQALLEREQ